MWSVIPSISRDVRIFSKNKAEDTRFGAHQFNYLNFELDGKKCIIQDVTGKVSSDKDTFSKLVKESKFSQSTVGNGRTNKVDEKVRKSSFCDAKIMTERYIYTEELFKHPEFLNIFPEYYYPFMENPKYLYGKLLKYEIGDFFARHTDGKANSSHFLTIIILPPKEINQYEGGELIFYTDGGQITITNQMLNNWTFIIFRTTVPHECLPVTSGTRYSFTFQYHMSDSIISFFRNYTEPQLLEIQSYDNEIGKVEEEEEKLEGELELIDNEIEVLQAKLDELKNKKLEIENKVHECTSKLNVLVSVNDINMIINTQKLGKMGAIVLTKYYDSIRVAEELIGKHRFLYNYLMRKYEIVVIKNVECKGELDDKMYDNTNIDALYEKDDSWISWEIMDILGEDNDYNPRIKNIIYEISDESHGSKVRRHYEYNDDTYDMMASKSVTVIYYDKEIIGTPHIKKASHDNPKYELKEEEEEEIDEIDPFYVPH
jgi:predicted 2-oxoglutarate/Fe(II)-dependent dioxygenase YbiX